MQWVNEYDAAGLEVVKSDIAVIFLIHAIQTISPGFTDAWLAKLQVNPKLPIREVIEAY